MNRIEQRLQEVIPSEPVRAVSLYETFLAGCYEKANEINDSGGAFGEFVDGLFRGWIQARQAAGSDPDETACRLVAWMDHDPWGFTHYLDKEAVKVLDKGGLKAFEAQLRARYEAAPRRAPAAAGSARDGIVPDRSRWGAALRTLHVARKNVRAYIALAEETGVTAKVCHSIASMLATKRKPAEALDWVERGIDLDRTEAQTSMAGADLKGLKRILLKKLGRRSEALDAAWADYREHPSRFTYKDLVEFVPENERMTWNRRAIEEASGADFGTLMELLLETGETERLAALVDETTDSVLEGLSHFKTEPAARKLSICRPDIAARLWRALAMSIVDAGKSEYYGAALSNFAKARRCFKRAGLAGEWDKTVSRVRADHHRKTGFMAGFERLVAGRGPGLDPSFLEYVMARREGARSKGKR